MEDRAERLAQYIIENRTTVRAAAQKFGISKSTVHKDISERLPQFNRALYLQVKEVLEVNKAQRHIRGGIATRKKIPRHLSGATSLQTLGSEVWIWQTIPRGGAGKRGRSQPAQRTRRPSRRSLPCAGGLIP